MENIEEVLKKRGNEYGSFGTGAEIMQELKSVMREAPQWNNLTHEQAEALEMIAHKIGRILNGNPNYKDSWTDIVGYAKLIESNLEN